MANRRPKNLRSKQLKERVDLLLDKIKKQELNSSTGTEEEQTERGRLLKAIEVIVEEE